MGKLQLARGKLHTPLFDRQKLPTPVSWSHTRQMPKRKNYTLPSLAKKLHTPTLLAPLIPPHVNNEQSPRTWNRFPVLGLRKVIPIESLFNSFASEMSHHVTSLWRAPVAAESCSRHLGMWAVYHRTSYGDILLVFLLFPLQWIEIWGLWTRKGRRHVFTPVNWLIDLQVLSCMQDLQKDSEGSAGRADCID